MVTQSTFLLKDHYTKSISNPYSSEILAPKEAGLLVHATTRSKIQKIKN